MSPHLIFRALADPSRLRILNLLLVEPLCVCQLEHALNLPQSLISRHLAYLRAAGVVQDRRHGTRVQYSVVRDHPGMATLAACLPGLLLTEEIHRADRRRWERTRNPCCPTPADRPPAQAATVRKGATL